MDVVKGIRDVLIAAAGVTGSLETYDFGSGSEPAIFTVDPVPSDAVAPLIQIVESTSVLSSRTRGTRAAEYYIDVALCGDKKDSYSELRSISGEIWKALDRASVTVTGYEAPICVCSPGKFMKDKEGFPVYVFDVKVLVREI